MEDFYWWGYSIALLIEITALAIGFGFQNSIKSKNFEKIGLHYSIFQGKFIEIKKPSWISHFLLVLFRIFINPFFSWIIVVSRVIGAINYIKQKLETPEKIKEIDFKIGSTILDKKSVQNLLIERANFLGKTIIFDDSWDMLRTQEQENTLVLQDENGWYGEFLIHDQKQKICKYYGHAPEYNVIWNSIYEYKIESNKVFERAVEKRFSYSGVSEEYEIKNGVVLEDDIRKQGKQDHLTIKQIKEKIQDLNKETKWQPIKNPIITYFVLSKHPEILSPQELKKELQQNLEKIKSLISRFQNLCDKYHVGCDYDEYNYMKLNFKIVQPEDEENFMSEMRLLEEENNCKGDEIFKSKINIQIIEGYLNNFTN